MQFIYLSIATSVYSVFVYFKYIKPNFMTTAKVMHVNDHFFKEYTTGLVYFWQID